MYKFRMNELKTWANIGDFKEGEGRHGGANARKKGVLWIVISFKKLFNGIPQNWRALSLVLCRRNNEKTKSLPLPRTLPFPYPSQNPFSPPLLLLPEPFLLSSISSPFPFITPFLLLKIHLNFRQFCAFFSWRVCKGTPWLNPLLSSFCLVYCNFFGR